MGIRVILGCLLQRGKPGFLVEECYLGIRFTYGYDASLVWSRSTGDMDIYIKRVLDDLYVERRPSPAVCT